MISVYLLKKPTPSSPAEQQLDALVAQWLPAQAIAYGERYRLPSRRHSYLYSRVLLRYALATKYDCTPATFTIVRAKHGGIDISTPSQSHLPIHCSISHCHSAELVAISDSPSVSHIGIDIEEQHRRAHAIPLTKRYFSPDVQRWVADGKSHTVQQHRFLQVWTQAEALAKAMQTGLSDKTAAMQFDFTEAACSLSSQQPFEKGITQQWHGESAQWLTYRWAWAYAQQRKTSDIKIQRQHITLNMLNQIAKNPLLHP